jgi:hypothetical protein
MQGGVGGIGFFKTMYFRNLSILEFLQDNKHQIEEKHERIYSYAKIVLCVFSHLFSKNRSALSIIRAISIMVLQMKNRTKKAISFLIQSLLAYNITHINKKSSLIGAKLC